jgi:TPR repeat protein
MAAERGHTIAQFKLGECCENGRGARKDLVEAVEWYQKAAEQGHTASQEAVNRLTPQLHKFRKLRHLLKSHK